MHATEPPEHSAERREAGPHRGALQAAVDAAAGGEGIRPRVSQPRGVEQRDVPVLRLADQRREIAACWQGACIVRVDSRDSCVPEDGNARACPLCAEV